MNNSLRFIVIVNDLLLFKKISIPFITVTHISKIVFIVTSSYMNKLSVFNQQIAINFTVKTSCCKSMSNFKQPCCVVV